MIRREDLNGLVRRHIAGVLSNGLARAVGTLEHDVMDLISAGMVTLNAKLAGVEDEKLVGRVVEVWGFFWDQVLTYLEGVRLLFLCLCIVEHKSRFFCLCKRTESCNNFIALQARLVEDLLRLVKG